MIKVTWTSTFNKQRVVMFHSFLKIILTTNISFTTNTSTQYQCLNVGTVLNDEGIITGSRSGAVLWWVRGHSLKIMPPPLIF